MRKTIKAVIAAVCFLACGIIFSCGRTENISLDIASETGTEQEAVEEADAAAAVPEESAAEEPVTEAESEVRDPGVIVHVCGAVNKPDVYELEGDSRISDAIDAAGGFAEDADRDYLNLAECLSDGMQVYVPTLKEVDEGYTVRRQSVGGTGVQTTAESITHQSEKININTADEEELKKLKGVGDSRAKDIIEYRETIGSFKKIEDIMLVPGIKSGMFEKIKNDIEV